MIEQRTIVASVKYLFYECKLLPFQAENMCLTTDMRNEVNE